MRLTHCKLEKKRRKHLPKGINKASLTLKLKPLDYKLEFPSKRLNEIININAEKHLLCVSSVKSRFHNHAWPLPFLFSPPGVSGIPLSQHSQARTAVALQTTMFTVCSYPEFTAARVDISDWYLDRFIDLFLTEKLL